MESSGQPAGQQPGKSSGLDPKVASLLTYLCSPITSIIFMIIEKENKLVRYHAWQSLFFWLAIFAISIILNVLTAFVPALGILLLIFQIAYFIVWIILMVKAYKGEKFKLPMIGDLAEKQVNK